MSVDNSKRDPEAKALTRREWLVGVTMEHLKDGQKEMKEALWGNQREGLLVRLARVETRVKTMWLVVVGVITLVILPVGLWLIKAKWG